MTDRQKVAYDFMMLCYAIAMGQITPGNIIIIINDGLLKAYSAAVIQQL